MHLTQKTLRERIPHFQILAGAFAEFPFSGVQASSIIYFSKERLLAWAESDKQASGGALGEWVYGRQSISQNDGQSSNVDEIDKLQSDSLNGWGQIPPRAYERPVEPE